LSNRLNKIEKEKERITRAYASSMVHKVWSCLISNDGFMPN